MTLKVDNIQNENASEANVVLNTDGSISIPSQIKHVGDENTLIEFETDTVKVQTNGSERMRINNNGRLLFGGTATEPDYNQFGQDTDVSIVGSGGLGVVRGGANASGPQYFFKKTRGTAPNGTTAVSSGDNLGTINWVATNGTDTRAAADIQCLVDGTADANNMPGRLVFRTTSGNTISERMRITNDGKVGIGGATTPIFKLDILEGTANTGANANNPSQLSVTGPNKAHTTGGATVFINSNTDMAADTGGSISFTGRNTSSSSTTIAHAVIKGAKENATSGNFESYYAVAVSNHAAGGLVERMRINSAGRLLVGTATPLLSAGHSLTCSDNSGGGALVVSNTDTATSSPACSFATATNSTATSNFLVKFFIN